MAVAATLARWQHCAPRSYNRVSPSLCGLRAHPFRINRVSRPSSERPPLSPPLQLLLPPPRVHVNLCRRHRRRLRKKNKTKITATATATEPFHPGHRLRKILKHGFSPSGQSCTKNKRRPNMSDSQVSIIYIYIYLENQLPPPPRLF